MEHGAAINRGEDEGSRRRAGGVLGRFEPHVVDAALAVGLAVFGLVETWPGYVPRPENCGRVDWIAYLMPMLLALAATLPLALRRRYPVAVLLVNGAAMATWQVRGGESPSAAFLAFFVAIFSAGAYAADRRRSLLAYGGLAAIFLWLWWSSGQLDPWLVFMFVFATGIWLAGDALRTRTAELKEHERRAGELELQRSAALRQAAAEERARIARELHDVIAHNLSVVVIQAGAAQRVLDEQPEAAREALHQVEASGRVAMTEMRRLLGVLRRGDDEPLTVPQPGVASLTTLLDDIRVAGLPVMLRTSGEDRTLPPGIDVSVYRIVQEALTNTLRHAGATKATVEIRYLPRAVEIEVVDDGRGAGEARPGGDVGHGLAGMRERAELFDGAFEAGPRPEGGFAVRVRLPSEPAGAKG
jgi:signal transduction histidine kinase